MAFITGVDLEGRLSKEDALALPKKRPPRPRRGLLELENGSRQGIALCDQDPVNYGLLLKSTVALEDDGDPLEDLRRRIKRTRAKMDSQKEIMNGFLHDVQQMQHLDRCFSSSELSAPSSPAGKLALGTSKSAAAIGCGPRSELVPQGRGSSITNRTRDPSTAPLALRPSSASRSSSLRSGRELGRQSECLAESRSQPALGNLHQAAPLVLPPRRAPPGAPCSEAEKVLAASSAARRSAAKEIVGNIGVCTSRKMLQLSRTPAFV